MWGQRWQMVRKLLRLLAVIFILCLSVISISIGTQASPTWWNNDWRYMAKLAFKASTIGANLSFSPVRVYLTPANFDFSKAQPAGQDIRFVDSSGTISLNYEISYWSPTAAEIYVSVPLIHAGSTTDYMYMYYGNPTATDGQNKAAVWLAAGSVGVWHFSEMTGLTVHDSTINANDGTISGNVSWSNYALKFNSHTDGLVTTNNGSSLNLTGDHTILVWSKPSEWSGVGGDPWNYILVDKTGMHSNYEIYGGVDGTFPVHLLVYSIHSVNTTYFDTDCLNGVGWI